MANELAQPGRREVIKRGAAAAGAAWVAPTIISMEVAGAATTGCYAFRIVCPDTSCSLPSLTSDCTSQTGQTFEAAIIALAATGSDPCSAALSGGAAITSGTCTGGGTLEVTGPGCTINFLMTAGGAIVASCVTEQATTDTPSTSVMFGGGDAVPVLYVIVCCGS